MACYVLQQRTGTGRAVRFGWNGGVFRGNKRVVGICPRVERLNSRARVINMLLRGHMD